MAFDPNAAATRFFINDVGQRGWEEINLGQPGADYGWNCREAAHINSTTGKCSPTPPNMVDPIHEYPRSTGCAAITGGAFVPNGVWPAQYDNTYLFGDYVCGKIFRLAPNGSGGYTASEFVTGMGTNSAVAMTFGPYGASQALYYTTYANGGEVRRLAYAQAPVAALAAQPASGPLPLAVTFSALGSYDPEGQPLRYDYTFGDGASLLDSASSSASHTYASPGVYTATLVVRDPGGLASAPASVTIQAGNTAPAPAILQPPAGLQPSVGQVITLLGQATDPEDGALPAAALSWDVRQYHVDAAHPGLAHWHPFHEASGVASTAITMPPPEDLAAAALSYLEVRLTASDSQGLAAVVTRTLQPALVNLTLATMPPGLTLAANGEAFATPRTVVGWPGWALPLAAPAQQTGASGQTWYFQSWSHGAPREHTLVVPASDAAYTAAYVTTPADFLDRFLPFITRAR
jgi:PKD repeat protein